MQTFPIIITTPERVVYEDVAESVTIPTVDGAITVLPHHMPLVAVLKAGEMIIRHRGKAEPYALAGGFAEIRPEKLVVLADTVEHISEIDEQRANEAVARAEIQKTELRQDHEAYATVTAKLERDLSRLRIIRKYRHRGHQGITQESIRKE